MATTEPGNINHSVIEAISYHTVTLSANKMAFFEHQHVLLRLFLWQRISM